MGLKAGTDGSAEVQAFGAMERLGPMDYQQDYLAGCMYGLNHQSAQWTQGRSAPR
ncbi:MAG TPA: hypothetical protein VFB19_08810 [Mycobacterium sp.]|nr:hypothetical protein [Mycobacterium sp.]